MPASITTVLKLDDKNLKTQLEQMKKYYNDTYKEMNSSVNTVNEAESSLLETKKRLISESASLSKSTSEYKQELSKLAIETKALATEQKALNKADEAGKILINERISTLKTSIATLEKDIASKKQSMDVDKGIVATTKDLIQNKSLELQTTKNLLQVQRGVLSEKRGEIAHREKESEGIGKKITKLEKEEEATKKLTLAQKQLIVVNQELAKAQFQQKTPSPTSKEAWSTADIKSYYSSLEKSSKDAEIATEKLTLAETALKEQEKKLYSQLYENTAATNAYNKAVERLNHQHSIGAIDQKQYSAGLDKEKQNLKEAELAAINHSKSTESVTNSFVRHIRQIETAALVLYTLKTAYDVTLGKGIEVNKMMEDNTSGIAALLSANTQMVTSNGTVVDSYQKFAMGQNVAKDTMEKLRLASIKTYATFPQLTEIFQQAIGQTLSMGDSFGSTTEDIINNTVKLSQRMSNIAGAIGMPMDRVREEIRSLMSGNVSTDSLISTMIFGSPSAANQAINEAKKRGENGVKELMDKMLKPFDALENVESYTKNILALEDAWSQAMKAMSEPVFKDLTVAFREMAQSINSNQKEIIEGFNTFYEKSKQFAGILDDLAVAAAAYYGTKGIIGAYGKAGEALSTLIGYSTVFDEKTNKNIASVGGLAQNMKALALANPFTAWATGIAAVVAGVYELQRISEKLSGERFTTGIKGNISKASGTLTEDSNKEDVDKVLKSYEAQITARAKLLASADKESAVYKRNLEAIMLINDEMIKLSKIQDGSAAKGKVTTELGKLVTQIPVNADTLKDAITYNNKALEETLSLTKKIEEANKDIEQRKKRQSALPKTAEYDQSRKDVQKEIDQELNAIKNMQKEISEIKQKENEKNQKALEDAQKKQWQILKEQKESRDLESEIEYEIFKQNSGSLSQLEILNKEIVSKYELLEIDKKSGLKNKEIQASSLAYQKAITTMTDYAKKEQEDIYKATAELLEVERQLEEVRNGTKRSRIEVLADERDKLQEVLKATASQIEQIKIKADIAKVNTKILEEYYQQQQSSIKTENELLSIRRQIDGLNNNSQENRLEALGREHKQLNDLIATTKDKTNLNALKIQQANLELEITKTQAEVTNSLIQNEQSLNSVKSESISLNMSLYDTSNTLLGYSTRQSEAYIQQREEVQSLAVANLQLEGVLMRQGSAYQTADESIKRYMDEVQQAKENTLEIKNLFEDLEDQKIHIDIDTTGLDKGLSAIANATKVATNYHNNNINLQKREAAANQRYSDEFIAAKGDEIAETKAWGNLQLANGKINEDRQTAEINAYGALAGAMASAFEKGSKEALAFQAIQATLGIVNAYTAITSALATPPAPTGIALGAMVAAQALPIIGILASMGGSSGGGGGSSYSMSEMAGAKIAELENEAFINRLDQQIELLEAIEKNGSAQKLGVERAAVEFIQAKNEWVQDVFDISRVGWVDARFSSTVGEGNTTRNSDQWQSIIDYYSSQDMLNPYEMSGNNIRINTELLRTNVDEFIEIMADMSQMVIGEGFSYTGPLGQSIAGTVGFGEEGHQAFLSAIRESFTEIQGYLNDWAVSVVDSTAELQDASETMQELYDSITGTTTYADAKLRGAFADFDSLLRGGESYSDYLVRNINNIESSTAFIYQLSGVLDENGRELTNYELLLSKNVDLIDEQMLKVDEFSQVTGNAFEGGAEEALNYLESIELVAEAMANSRDNIKSFEDSFKNEQQLAEDMAATLGVTLATTAEGLQELFISLQGGLGGLTDSELEFLNSNKNLIESLEGTTGAIEDNVNRQSQLNEIYKLTHTELENEAYLRQQVLDGMGEEDRARQIQINTLTDTAAALAESNALLESQTNEATSLNARLAELIATDKEAYQRTLELERALSDANREILNSIYAEEDRQKALIESNALLETSSNNIKSFAEGLLTSDATTQHLADTLGVTLATDVAGLSALFTQLSTDTDGLTDADLALLNANKELVSSTTDLDKILSDTTSNISTLESAFEKINDTVKTLREGSKTAEENIQDFYTSMAETKALSSGTDFEAYTKSLDETIAASAALTNAENFTTNRDMQFAQLVAANQFEELAVTNLTQIDYLKQIEENTRLQIEALVNSINALGTNILSTMASSTTGPYAPGITAEYISHQRDYVDSFGGIDEYMRLLNSGAITGELPSFAVGTPNVPYDMLAQIHKGEMIPTATMSEGIRRGEVMLGDTSGIVDRMDKLITRIEKLEETNSRYLERIEYNTTKSRTEGVA